MPVGGFVQGAVVQWRNMGGVCMCVDACVFACMLDRKLYEEKQKPHSYEWDVRVIFFFFCRQVPNDTKAIFFAVRDAV